MVLGIDSETVSVKDTLPPVVKAREEEAAVLNSPEVQDAWLCAYYPSGVPNEQHVTKGWTRGAHTVPPDRVVHDQGDTDDKPTPSPHRHRIDRIHISASVVPTLSRCFTHGLAFSDHRAVIVEHPPAPQADTVQRRARMPRSFLKCADTMELMTHRLCSLPYPDENWWDTAITEVPLMDHETEERTLAEEDEVPWRSQ